MSLKINSSSTVKQGLSGAIVPVGTTFEVRDVWKKVMERVDPYQYPIQALTAYNKRMKWVTTSNPQGLFEFPERELTPNMDTLVSITSGTGTGTLRIVPGEPNLYVKGKTIQFLDTKESGTITNATSTYFDVLRDYDSDGNAQNWTTPAAGGTSANILSTGMALGDKSDPPENVYMMGYMRKGRVQLFQYTMSMTDMMRASAMNGGVYGGDWWKQHLEDTMIAMKRDTEMAYNTNENHQLLPSATYGSTEVITKLEGVPYAIKTYGGFSDTYGNGVLQKSQLLKFLRMSKRGSTHKTFLVGDELCGQIEDIADDKLYSTEKISVLGSLKDGGDKLEILRIKTYNLIVDVIRNPMWEEGTEYYSGGIILDNNYLYGCNFANDGKGSRKWRWEQAIQPNGKPYELAQYLSHVGIGLACAPYHGRFTRS